MVVTSTNFEKEVIQASYEKPVLVDFWAEWCGPCRILSPLLEKLEKAYDGKWKLVKINTDQEPQLAMQFRVTGIPHCVLFHNGKVVDSFTGALPEKMIRQFFDKHLPSKEKEMVKEDLKSKDVVKRKEAIQKIFQLPSVDEEIILEGLKNLILFIQNKDLTTINAFLNHVIQSVPFASSILDFIKKNKDEDYFWDVLEKIFYLFDETKRKEILDSFYNAFESKKEEKFKQLLILSFQIIGQNHPLSNEYRRKISRLIF
ncbi:MAG: thioredoxin [Leptonema sp. (in: bacteria)]